MSKKRVAHLSRLALLPVLLLFCPLVSLSQINTDRMMMTGRNALYFEDYVLSIQYFNQVINAKPYLSDPYFYRAVAKLSLEDFAGAENDCSRAISINPYVVNSYQVRGLARVYQGKFSQAAEDYITALKWDPESNPMRHNLILCYLQQDMIDDARHQIDTLLMINPHYAPAYSMQSGILMDENDTVGALSMIEKAIVLEKYDPSLLRARGLIKASMKQYEEAEQDLSTAIGYSPDESGFYIERALVRFYRNNLRGAMEDYDIALDIDPYNVIGHYNRGVLRSQIGDDNKAIEDFDMVVEAEPDNYMAVFNRGLLRDQTGDIAGAVQDYTTVLAEYPQFMYGYELRSAARYKLGDRKGGEQDELVVLKDRTANFGKSTGNSSADDVRKSADDENDNSDKTRKESDNDVWNYRKIVVADKEQAEFSSEYRGKVQNRNIDVKMLADYIFTWFGSENNSEVDREVRFSAEVERLNTSGKLPGRLQVSGKEMPLSENSIRQLFDDVDKQTALIDENSDNAIYYLIRGVDFFLLQDFNNAQSDFTEAILAGGDCLWAAYFGRATVRARISEMEKAEKSMDLKSSVTIDNSGTTNTQYQLIFNDLTKAIDLAPDFAYAYYNRANLEASAGDYRSAIADYSEAIAKNERLAEAYYNRGLSKVFLNRVKEGLEDFGKAGELGIYTAYNVMKRFTPNK